MRTWQIGDVHSLGLRTDLMLRRMAGSDIEERAGYLVVRTPANPGFWGRMRSGAGLFRDGGLARFQSVETHPDFRRQGLASAVLGHVARREPGARTLVTVADPDDQAIQLSRALGFAEAEYQIQLYRAPGS